MGINRPLSLIRSESQPIKTLVAKLSLTAILTGCAESDRSDISAIIGEASPYAVSAEICETEVYHGELDGYAIPVDEKARDFILHGVNGESYRLNDTLANGKPVFIMTGSYTCPQFRDAIPEYNRLVEAYGEYVNFWIVYVVEAHPRGENSPYMDDIWMPRENIEAGIMYEQPETYGERLKLALELENDFAVNSPIILDSPCNEFWTTYGVAPNRAYFIDTDRTVAMSQTWFEVSDAVEAIDAFLVNVL